MSTGLILNIVITALVAILIATISWWARKHPNRAKDFPERVRMPKVLAFLGWLCLFTGLLMGLFAFTHPRAPLGAQIASVAIALGGLGFVFMYRNFYVVPRSHEVSFRTVLGKEHLVPYSDIVHYDVRMLRGQPFLTFKSRDGVKLTLNIGAYDMTPLMRAIDFHRVTGRWPGREEATVEGFGH